MVVSFSFFFFSIFWPPAYLGRLCGRFLDIHLLSTVSRVPCPVPGAFFSRTTLCGRSPSAIWILCVCFFGLLIYLFFHHILRGYQPMRSDFTGHFCYGGLYCVYTYIYTHYVPDPAPSYFSPHISWGEKGVGGERVPFHHYFGRIYYLLLFSFLSCSSSALRFIPFLFFSLQFYSQKIPP